MKTTTEPSDLNGTFSAAAMTDFYSKLISTYVARLSDSTVSRGRLSWKVLLRW